MCDCWVVRRLFAAGGELPRTHWFPRLKEKDPQFADEMLHCEEVEGCPARLKLEELEEGDELVRHAAQCAR